MKDNSINFETVLYSHFYKKQSRFGIIRTVLSFARLLLQTGPRKNCRVGPYAGPAARSFSPQTDIR